MADVRHHTVQGLHIAHGGCRTAAESLIAHGTQVSTVMYCTTGFLEWLMATILPPSVS
jgi:hypothetical protein